MVKDIKVVLVVGASTGIGEATARLLVEEGHKVYGTSRDASRITQQGVMGLSMDLFDKVSMEAAIAEIVSKDGRIDVLIYSAGYYIAGAVEETPLKEVEDQMKAYFFAPVELTQIILPHMRTQKFGHLIFMSSTAGTVSIPFHAAYAASKAALGRWTEALAYELTPFGIHASYIEAGSINTNAPNAMRSPTAPKMEYMKRREMAETSFKNALKGGLDPDRIGETIVNVLKTKKPKIRYRVGAEGKFFPIMQAVMGEKLFRGMMSKAFKIDHR